MRTAEEEYSTDQDQDNSFEMNSTSGSDDLNMNEEEMRNFDINTTSHNKPSPPKKSVLFEENVDQLANKTAAHTLQNPGQLISDFYISNMNYAMRYSVEYVQQVAKDLRARRERLDSMNIGGHSVTPLSKHQRQDSFNRLHRSYSVDRLYAVRREHIRYANGADEYFGARNISFTTDDIQDIYMPSAIDNYKRKISVELERRRRFAQLELSMFDQQEHQQQQRAFSPVQFEETLVNSGNPVVLDDLDLFIIKKAKSSIETERLLAEGQKIKISQPHVQRDKRSQLNSVLVGGGDANFNLISRVHVKSPQFEFESEEPVHLERAATSRVQEGFTNFALINKVSTLMDNEVIPSSSSDSESISVSPVDSLNNLNMDSFGRPCFESPRPKYKEKALSFLSYSTATIEIQQVKLEKTHVSQIISKTRSLIYNVFYLDLPRSNCITLFQATYCKSCDLLVLTIFSGPCCCVFFFFD